MANELDITRGIFVDQDSGELVKSVSLDLSGGGKAIEVEYVSELEPAEVIADIGDTYRGAKISGFPVLLDLKL